MSDTQSGGLEARLIAKAWKDEAFKRALIEDPKGTIESEFGNKVPDGVEIHVHEQTADTRHLVLPSRPEGELSDDELEAAAGGVRPTYDADGNIIGDCVFGGLKLGR